MALQGNSTELQSFIPQHRKNSVRGKVIDKKWFSSIGCLWGLQVGGQEGAAPKNLVGCSFIIKRTVGEGEGLLCHSWVDTRLPSSILPPGWTGEFSCSYMIKLGPQTTVFYVWREHVLISWATEQGEGFVPPLSHCFEACLVLLLCGFVAKQACLVLWLNKSGFVWVIIELTGVSPIFLLTTP